MELDQILHILEKSLATYPMSKYRPPNYCPITEDQGTDQESVKLDTTEIYWPYDSDNTSYLEQELPKRLR